MKRQMRQGFSLIEMVIVILILGIIAAVAAPRMFDTASKAEENTTRQQLAVLRNAIEMHRAQNGSYPAAGQLTAEMGKLLNGPFPKPNIGTHRVATVYDDPDTDPSVLVASFEASQTAGWVYKAANGGLRLNIDSGLGSDW